MAKGFCAPIDCEFVTLDELRLAPRLNRQFVAKKGAWDGRSYNGTKIESFRYIASTKHPQWGEGWNYESSDNNHYNSSPHFEKNCGEWVILDTPKLAAYRYIRDDDDLETLTPVAIMTVTFNGNDAYTVYLPLGECCCIDDDYEDDILYAKEHYYQDGFKWKERPFGQILNALSKGKRICYTFYVYSKNGKRREAGGLRIL